MGSIRGPQAPAATTPSPSTQLVPLWSSRPSTVLPRVPRTPWGSLWDWFHPVLSIARRRVTSHPEGGYLGRAKGGEEAEGKQVSSKFHQVGIRGGYVV